MSESYFEITDQEWRSGSLAEDKLDQVQESFDSIGFAVVAGLVPPAICEQLMTAFLEDVELSQSWGFMGISSESMGFVEVPGDLFVLSGYPGFSDSSLKELIESKGLLDIRDHNPSGNTGELSSQTHHNL